MRIKWGALIVVISCTATAFAMAISGQDDTPSDIVGAVEKNHSPSSHPGADPHEQAQPEMHFDLSEIKRTVPDNTHTSGLFQSKSWYVSPPSQQAGLVAAQSAAGVSAASLPPPPPSAPQLPFKFIGRMIDGNEVPLFLANNNQLYSARVSDVLDSTYRVDKITEKTALLTYLPMNIQQELVFNSTAVGISALSASTSDTMQPSTPIRQQIEILR